LKRLGNLCLRHKQHNTQKTFEVKPQPVICSQNLLLGPYSLMPGLRHGVDSKPRLDRQAGQIRRPMLGNVAGHPKTTILPLILAHPMLI
jgi:hypothetical protein